MQEMWPYISFLTFELVDIEFEILTKISLYTYGLIAVKINYEMNEFPYSMCIYIYIFIYI